MIYQVKLISKDDNEYLFTTEAESEMQAVQKAEDRIKENGWEQYQYVFDEIKKVK